MDCHIGLAAIIHELERRPPRTPKLFVVVDLGDLHRGGRVGRLLGPGYADGLAKAAHQVAQHEIGGRSPILPIDMDCFAFWLPDDGGTGWQAKVRALIGKLREPLDCDGLPGAIVPSAGLARFIPGTTSVEDTVLAALVAALDARTTDESWLLLDAGAGQAQKRIQLLLAGLRPALSASDQLSLVYQPRIELRSGQCLGAEALLRWNHPAIGGIPPGEFIPLAEQTGLIRFVTAWVMEQAFSDVTAWIRNGYRHGVSINVSALNLAEANFASVLGESIRRQGADPALVEVELTEGALISDGARLRETVADIAALGMRISIDDFGTGYSNLFYLRQFPATTIKIDQSFIRSLPDNTRDQTIVRSMIELAHTLGYRVVAEGIETRAALEALTAWGCDEGQGYFLSRPVPTGALLAWISARGGGGTSV